MTERDHISRLPSVSALHERRYADALAQFPEDFESLGDDGDRLQLQLHQGNALIGVGRNQEARELYFDIYRVCREARFKEDFFSIGRKALMNAGLATKNLGEFDTAVRFYQEVLSQNLFETLTQELRMRNLLGALLTRLDRFQEAEVEFRAALSKLCDLDDNALESDICLNRAVLSFHLKQSDEAENWLNRARGKVGDDPERRLRVDLNLGTLLFDQGQDRQAWIYLDKARDQAKRHDLQRYLPLILAKQAGLRDREDMHAEATALAREAMELAETLQIDNRWVRETCQQILQSQVTNAQDDFGLANVLIRSHKMVAVSESMRRIIRDIEALATSDLPVLILGETGTGKELVASALHSAGARHTAPFIPVNCPAIPETLFESTLFGHVRGAFTGADQDREGLIELAKDGTIFLDEIGDLPLSIQPKLLRFLESGEYQKMGSSKRLWSNARIVAATNRNLDELMSAKQFRDDLMMRISAFRICLPALRDRREDIYFIAASLLEELNRQHETKKSFTPESLHDLNAYHYPGNVRELRNAVLRGFQVSNQDIQPDHLGLPRIHGFHVEVENVPATKQGTQGPEWLPRMVNQMELPGNLGLEDALLELEKRLIEKALQFREGDRERTAEDLGLSFRALKYKIAKHNIKSRKRRSPMDFTTDSQMGPRT